MRIMNKSIPRWLLITITVFILALIAWAAYLRVAKGWPWAPWTGFKGKTLYDLIELAIVPIAIGVIAIWFDRSERKTDREIASDRQQDTNLQNYLDKMTELLLEKELRKSHEGSEIRSVARSRTLSTLRTLDTTRKALLLQFLYEADVIGQDCIIDLRGADLSSSLLHHTLLSDATLIGANLSNACLYQTSLGGANLSETSLCGADLIEANLSMADLSQADLSGADFRGADLIKAYLSGADLSEANLSCAILIGANLEYAILNGSCLIGADLVGTNLQNAKLNSANLTQADLRGADLSYAELREAMVDLNQLVEARSLEGAIMPDGNVYNPAFHILKRKQEGQDISPTSENGASSP